MGIGENNTVNILSNTMDMVHMDISGCQNPPYGWLISPFITVTVTKTAAVTKVSRTRLSPSRSRSERPSVRLVYGQGSLR